jgi:hypothetical protein
MLVNAALNDRGDLVASVQRLTASAAVLSNDLVEVSASGGAHTFPAWRPLASIAADGTVAAESFPSTADEPMKLGWLLPDGSFHAASGSWTSALVAERLVVDGLRLVYLDTDDATLVVETPTERRAIPLPHAIAPQSPWLPKVIVAGGWASVADLRVALDPETVETIAAPSNGLREFLDPCNVPQVALEEDGSLLEPLRTDAVGGLYRSSDLGKSWTPIGESVSSVSEVGVTVSHGTYLVQAAVTYCGDSSWPAPPPGQGAVLLGDSLQVVRPSLQRQRVLTADMFAPVVSNDGLCVAYAEEKTGGGHSLNVWDLQTDRTVEVLATSSSFPPFQAQWMEPPRSTALRP